MNILSPNDLKANTEYYIEIHSSRPGIIKLNGTYKIICKTPMYNNVVCQFKNIKNISQKNLVITYDTTNLKYIFTSSNFDNMDVSISINELTTDSEYVLK
jgi:hypothetical protein